MTVGAIYAAVLIGGLLLLGLGSLGAELVASLKPNYESDGSRVVGGVILIVASLYLASAAYG